MGLKVCADGRAESRLSEVVVSVENLSKVYRLGQIGTGTLSHDLNVWWARVRGKPNPLLKIGQKDHGNRDGETIWALKDVSFTVNRGEVLGIIGRNGAGKSTLLKILTGVTAPTSGQIKARGRVASLLEVGTGFHPELTGRENIYLNGAILGMKKTEIARKFDEIVAFSEVEQFIDTPVKRYSSGMYVRLAFAVAANLDPEILLVDEVLAVGDTAFQKKCVGKMRDVSLTGRTVLVVSHNMLVVASLCSRAVWLNRGVNVQIGGVEQVVGAYERDSGSVSRAVDGRYRREPRPSGRAWIEWAEVADETGRPRSSFDNGEFMHLAVRISGSLPRASYFEWVLFTEKGQPATSGGTFFKERDLPLPAEGGVIRSRIGPIPLAEGTYRLHLRIGEQPGHELLDVWENVTSVLIASCVPEPRGLPFDNRRGIVYIPADYLCEPALDDKQSLGESQ
jgi:lipopolysaccharide transport system ATP-binding protein